MTAEPTAEPTPSVVAELHERVLAWYAVNARDLPWRRADATPWGVFVSEVMAQQTPVARVAPAWRIWLDRWPAPADLAADPPGEAVRAWDRLGYPRRALRLHEAARAMVERYDGCVPTSYEQLLTLPGVGPYTAAAVAAFAFGERTTVVDTNVRRVLARAVSGRPLPAVSLTRAESVLAARLVPDDPRTAAVWNVAAMELGALVCTARAPRCEACPLRDVCAWQTAGAPAYDGPPRRGQGFTGTDREVRGKLMAILRAAQHPVSEHDLRRAWPHDDDRRARCLDSLVADGLVEPLPDGAFRLPR